MTDADPVSDDKFDRYLIRGQLRERPRQFRGRDEAITLAHAVGRMREWLDSQPKPRGEVLIDLGFRLRRQPLTAVDITLSVISTGTDAANPGNVWWIDGRPELAVEILNHREGSDAIAERVEEYLACGVPLVWVFDPASRSVTIHRPAPAGLVLDGERVLSAELVLDDEDVLSGDPALPGFSARVADFFR